jgi:hypothetical protein
MRMDGVTLTLHEATKIMRFEAAQLPILQFIRAAGWDL